MPDINASANAAKLADTSSLSKSFLEEAGATVVREIQAEIRRTAFKGQPVALLRSFKSEVRNGQIVVSSDHPAATYLNDGVRAYQMTHLTKARRPIPIVTDDGRVIFRSATQESMRSGSWRHPGFAPKNFIERGVERGMREVGRKAVEHTRAQIARRFASVGGTRKI